MIDEDELEPQPIIRAAIRALRRAPPPPPQRLHVVHGDYRTGNFLYDKEGAIRGILDWEMAHLGDPLEDLAWSLNRVWCWARDERVGGLTTKAERDRASGKQASGLRADPEALRWWELFSSVKGQAIWISGSQEYQDGANKDPVLAFSGWWLTNSQDRAALETLGKLAMKPDVPKLLEILSAQLLFDVAPNVQPSYRQSSVGITGILLDDGARGVGARRRAAGRGERGAARAVRAGGGAGGRHRSASPARGARRRAATRACCSRSSRGANDGAARAADRAARARRGAERGRGRARSTPRSGASWSRRPSAGRSRASRRSELALRSGGLGLAAQYE